MVWYFSLLKKGPKSHFEPIYFALLVFFYLSFSRGRQGVHFIYQLLLFPFHLFSLTLFLLLCFIVGEEVADYDTLQ